MGCVSQVVTVTSPVSWERDLISRLRVLVWVCVVTPGCLTVALCAASGSH